MEARKRRAEYILKEEELKAACLAEGKDWEIEKLRQVIGPTWILNSINMSCMSYSVSTVSNPYSTAFCQRTGAVGTNLDQGKSSYVAQFEDTGIVAAWYMCECIWQEIPDLVLKSGR